MPRTTRSPRSSSITRLPYRAVRVAQDLLFVALALAFHGQVGIGTVMTAFFAGPLIDFFTEKVNKPLMKKDLAALGGVSGTRQDHPLALLTGGSGRFG